MRSGFYKEGSLELKLLLVRQFIADGNYGNRNEYEREEGRIAMDIIDSAIKLIYIKGLKL